VWALKSILGTPRRGVGRGKFVCAREKLAPVQKKKEKEGPKRYLQSWSRDTARRKGLQKMRVKKSRGERIKKKAEGFWTRGGRWGGGGIKGEGKHTGGGLKKTRSTNIHAEKERGRETKGGGKHFTLA